MEELVFGRRYRAVERIGSGGMADVYKAVDEVLGRTVAVKVLHARYATEPSFVARFRQEAQAAANLSHPNIVNMYDWGREGETYYIVMEYVNGIDLKALVASRGPLDPMKAADYAAQVCSALAVAHGYDIIHRDIKPHNIILTPEGTIKVMDFGIARAGNTTMTQTGSVLGTAQYISPEQAQGKNLTPASDLYSLGATLYELVTGRPPFEGDTPVATALMQVNSDPIPPRQIRASIPPALEAVIMRSMRKDPGERYDSANEMRADLKRVMGGQPAVGGAYGGTYGSTNDQTSVLPPIERSSSSYQGARPQIRPIPERRTSPWVWLALVAIILVTIGGVAWGLGLFGSAKVVVPSLAGLTEVQAEVELAKAGLEIGEVTTENSSETPIGIIMGQNPDAGTQVEPGAAVNITVSAGLKKATIPELAGMTEAQAIEALRASDLEYDRTIRENNAEIEKGLVIRTDPIEGTEVPVSTRVKLVVSEGVAQVEVPSVVGKTYAEAKTLLEAAGLKVSKTESYSDTVTEGTVISQKPDPDTIVKPGATITLEVSKGIEVVIVPGVLTFELADAIDALEAVGLVAEVIYVDTHNPNEDGKVVNQTPIGGASAAPGSTVEIEVGQMASE